MGGVRDRPSGSASAAAASAAHRVMAFHMEEGEREEGERGCLEEKIETRVVHTTTSPSAALVTAATAMAIDFSGLGDIWKRVCDMGNETAWVVTGFSDPKSLVIQATGCGGLDEVLAALKDDEVQIAGLRITAIDKKGTSTR